MDNSENEVAGCSKNTAEMRKARKKEADRLRLQRKRARESSKSAERRRKANAESTKRSRLIETPQETAKSRQSDAEAKRKKRNEETAVEKYLRIQSVIEAKRKKMYCGDVDAKNITKGIACGSNEGTTKQSKSCLFATLQTRTSTRLDSANLL